MEVTHSVGRKGWEKSEAKQTSELSGNQQVEFTTRTSVLTTTDTELMLQANFNRLPASEIQQTSVNSRGFRITWLASNFFHWRELLGGGSLGVLSTTPSQWLKFFDVC